MLAESHRDIQYHIAIHLDRLAVLIERDYRRGNRGSQQCKIDREIPQVAEAV